MAQDRPVRAVFFDFGGVVGRMDEVLHVVAVIEARHGLPKGSFLRTLHALPEWEAAQVGQGTEEAAAIQEDDLAIAGHDAV